MEWTPDFDRNNAGFRLLRAVLLIGAVIWGAAWALLPVSFSELGTTTNCGLAAVAASNPGTDDVDQTCAHLGAQHLLIAVLGFFVLLMLAGSIGLMLARQARRYRRFLQATSDAAAYGNDASVGRFLWLRWIVAAVVVGAFVVEAAIVLLHHPTSGSTSPAISNPPSSTGSAGDAGSPVYANCGQGPAGGAPAYVTQACGDGDMYIKNITWTSWDSSGASGSGTLMVNDCTPSCLAGTYHSMPASIEMSNPTQTSVGVQFTTATVNGASWSLPVLK